MDLGSARLKICWWPAVTLAALAGLALRIAAAQGGLWTDEAWSAIYAQQAGDAAGVFLRINHDNNHHLNSLWLLAVGMTAPPWLARVPAILCGTATIIVAAVFLRRWSPMGGIVAAVLFALSPVMVTFGAEARGYAPMLLATLVMALLVARGLERADRLATPWLIAATAVLGMFSHLTMAAPIVLLSLWVYLERRAVAGPNQGLRQAAQLVGPALAAMAAVLIFVFAAAAATPAGMRLGGYVPFAWTDYGLALDDLSGWTLGISAGAQWLGPLIVGLTAALVALRPPAWLGPRARLYALLIFGVPLAVAFTHAGNPGFARYYLSSAVGLLLLAAEWLGHGLATRGGLRTASAAGLATILVVALWHDVDIVTSQRGHPEEALALIARQSPLGARLALQPQRFAGIITVEAAQTGYKIRIVDGCAPAQFVLVSQPRFAPVAQRLHRCGVPLRALAGNSGTPLSGDHWVLYAAERLPTTGPFVSGPNPGALTSRLADRAGVAQG